MQTGHIYTTYREAILADKGLRASAHLQSLRKYADVYKKINNLPRNTRIGISLSWLDILGVTTVYPFLLELFSTYESDDPEIEKNL